MRVGALCAGYGGLELGLQLAGIDTDLVWVSETDKHASAVLDARFGVSNLGDLTEIADPPQVDAITAGWPCQAVSHAGNRAGIDDKRWLIRDVVTVAKQADARSIGIVSQSNFHLSNQRRRSSAIIKPVTGNFHLNGIPCPSSVDKSAIRGQMEIQTQVRIFRTQGPYFPDLGQSRVRIRFSARNKYGLRSVFSGPRVRIFRT